MVSIWAAYLMDLLAGDPYWFPHPVRLIGKYISLVEKKVRKITSSPRGLKLGGIFLTLTTILLAYLSTFYLLKAAKLLHLYFYYFLNIILMWNCLAAKCLKQEAGKVGRALKEGDLAQARTYLSYIVGRDTQQLTEEEVAKAAVETVVENTSDGIIAPLFYMILGGAPLAMAYKAANTMDSMVGYKNEKYLHFGRAAARFDDLVNFLPARITGIFLVAAAFFLRMDHKKSWSVLLRDRKNHSSPNCGYTEAPAAGALGIQLGGAHLYFNQMVYKPTIGDDTRPVEPEDINRVIKLMYMSSFLTLLFFSLLIWIIKGQII